MAELYRLEESGFKGQVAVNFDGRMVKDITTTNHRVLEEVEIDDDLLAELKEIAAKIAGA